LNETVVDFLKALSSAFAWMQ